MAALVLSRKRNEEIVIGDEEIVIAVVECFPNKVRLRISADERFSIHRREVFDEIKRKCGVETTEQAEPGSGQ